MENKQDRVITTVSGLKEFGIRPKKIDTEEEFYWSAGKDTPELPVTIETTAEEYQLDKETLLTLGKVSVQLASLELAEDMSENYSKFLMINQIAKTVLNFYGKDLRNMTPPMLTISINRQSGKMFLSLGYPKAVTPENLGCLISVTAIIMNMYSTPNVLNYIQATAAAISTNCHMVAIYTKGIFLSA